MDVGNAEAKLGAQSAEPDSVVLHDGMGMSGSVVPAAVLSDVVAASKIADGGGRWILMLRPVRRLRLTLPM